MTELTPDQAEDLRDVQAVGNTFSADLVIIGATAYRIFVNGPHGPQKMWT